MGYQLYGSQTSPFVRRIRLLMENVPYEFKEMSIFEQKDAEVLNRINPINQIPVLQDQDQVIWDSRQIFNYLNRKHHFQDMTWEDENLLTAIGGAMDSGVSLLLMKRSNINTDEPSLYVSRQKERIKSVLHYLSQKDLKDWNFLSMSLYAFLDWANFRQIIALSDYPEFMPFLEINSKRSIVIQTQIPKA